MSNPFQARSIIIVAEFKMLFLSSSLTKRWKNLVKACNYWLIIISIFLSLILPLHRMSSQLSQKILTVSFSTSSFKRLQSVFKCLLISNRLSLLTFSHYHWSLKIIGKIVWVFGYFSKDLDAKIYILLSQKSYMMNYSNISANSSLEAQMKNKEFL